MWVPLPGDRPFASRRVRTRPRVCPYVYFYGELFLVQCVGCPGVEGNDGGPGGAQGATCVVKAPPDEPDRCG